MSQQVTLDVLNPDNPELTPVSFKLATVRRLSDAAFFLPVFIALVVLTFVLSPWFALGAAVTLVVWGVLWWFHGRMVTAHRYREDEDDFIVASGRWWRSVTVVPYGRIQFVDLDEGPLLRLFGLATLKLKTASASSDAAVTGVERQEAQLIRQRLSEKARDRMAGL